MSDLRWRAWFQRSREPVFVLRRSRRLVFVNAAWEALTGVSAERARQLACRRRRAAPDDPWETLLEWALCPPDEVLAGHAAHVRRRVPHFDPARRWWDIDFLPLGGEDGPLMIVGRIVPAGAVVEAAAVAVPEAALELRQAVARRHRLESLASERPAMQKVAEQLRLAAPLRVPVLFVGERGTGKRWAARVLHELSPRRQETFCALDCARLPGGAVAGVLFGEPVAGTIYLNEPSRLPRELQQRLCDGLAQPEGDDVAPRGPRLLAGCATDPADEVRVGRLLEELACRLGLLTISLPPLRERLDDLPHLLGPLLARAATATGTAVSGLTPAALDVMRAHRWPGNLDELYRVLVSACGHASGERIEAADLPFYLRLERRPPPEERPLSLRKALDEAERRLIALALRRAGGNKSRTAELLEIWRPLLLRRMAALGLAPPKDKSEPQP